MKKLGCNALTQARKMNAKILLERYKLPKKVYLPHKTDCAQEPLQDCTDDKKRITCPEEDIFKTTCTI